VFKSLKYYRSPDRTKEMGGASQTACTVLKWSYYGMDSWRLVAHAVCDRRSQREESEGGVNGSICNNAAQCRAKNYATVSLNRGLVSI